MGVDLSEKILQPTNLFLAVNAILGNGELRKEIFPIDKIFQNQGTRKQ